VGNSLVDMYAKCGSMEDVQRAFNKLPSPDAGHLECSYIGHVKHVQGQKVLELF
jgi:hypothetical protein